MHAFVSLELPEQMAEAKGSMPSLQMPDNSTRLILIFSNYKPQKRNDLKILLGLLF